MASFIAPTVSLVCLIAFIVGCALALHGVIHALVLLDKPSRWVCHLRGVGLIALFILSAVGVCAGVFNRQAPCAAGAIAVLVSGVLLAGLARRLRARAWRRLVREVRSSVTAGGA